MPILEEALSSSLKNALVSTILIDKNHRWNNACNWLWHLSFITEHLSLAVDGSKDDQINRFKAGQQCDNASDNILYLSTTRMSWRENGFDEGMGIPIEVD